MTKKLFQCGQSRSAFWCRAHRRQDLRDAEPVGNAGDKTFFFNFERIPERAGDHMYLIVDLQLAELLHARYDSVADEPVPSQVANAQAQGT